MISPKLRKELENDIINGIFEINKSEMNKQRYIEFFKSLNNKEFEQFIIDLELGVEELPIEVPTSYNKDAVDGEITLENNRRVAKKWGVSFDQVDIFVEGEEGMPNYKIPVKGSVVVLPIAVTAQLLMKKASVAYDSKSMDYSTGQVTNQSVSAKITIPEMRGLNSLGLKNTLVELAVVRGGDLGARNVFNKSLVEQGSGKVRFAKNFSTGVESKKTLKNMLIAAQIKSNL